MTKIYTSDIHYKGADKLDITRETGVSIFAPTWDMVNGIHNHTLSESEYQERYLDMMMSSYSVHTEAWYNMILGKDRVVLCCFCLPDIFCHRYILTSILRGMGCEYCGELIKIGREYIIIHPKIMNRFFRAPILHTYSESQVKNIDI